MLAASPSRSASKPQLQNPWIFWLPLLMIASAGAGVGFTIWYLRAPEKGSEARENSGQVASAESENVPTAQADEPVTVSLAVDQWESSGIELAKIGETDFADTLSVTGMVEINEDRLAHIYSMVEGSVNSVNVSLGEVVAANQELAVIHSREVGTAKLELFQAQLALETAKNQQRLVLETVANARELLQFLRSNRPIQELESTFRDRPMGDYRELALAAYSNFLKSEADYQRLSGVGDSGAVAGRQLLAAEANLNADKATFQARIEQIAYDLDTSTLSATQAVREAEARVLVAQTNLRILGCTDEELMSISPAEQGEALSHYSIRAPFDGTVISKDIVLHEQVRSDVMLLRIADLSSVWISVNIHEEHVPVIAGLAGKPIRFSSRATGDQRFDATVFYTGELVDESTRTLTLRALASNTDHRLKPGTFVTIELPRQETSLTVTVPATAIQEHEGNTFVFVHIGEDRFERREVSVGATNGTQVVVMSGVSPGETIASRGGFLLKSLMLADLLGEE